MGPRIGEKKFKFAENERVLCYQGPIIYEAKSLKCEVRDGDKAYYLIHYNGWNKHWDEWVPESRVLKYNDANLLKQKELLKRYSKEKSKRYKIVKPTRTEKDVSEKKKISEASSVSTVTSGNGTEPKKEQALMVSTEREKNVNNTFISSYENVAIPKELHSFLIDDWDLITRQKQLFHLPVNVSVEEILKRFLQESGKMSTDQFIALREMVCGIQEYFNVMLGSQLLYKFERPQYGDVLERYPKYTVSQIYGAFHLLRFFVKLESILSSHSVILSPKQTNEILYCAHECLVFMCLNRDKFFNINEYEIAPAEYHRRAMT